MLGGALHLNSEQVRREKGWTRLILSEVDHQALVSSLPLSQVNFNDTTDTPDLLSSEQATTAVECGRASYVTTLGAPPTPGRLREMPRGVPSLLRLSLEASKEPYFLSSVIVEGSSNHACTPPHPSRSANIDSGKEMIYLLTKQHEGHNSVSARSSDVDVPSSLLLPPPSSSSLAAKWLQLCCGV